MSEANGVSAPAIADLDVEKKRRAMVEAEKSARLDYLFRFMSDARDAADTAQRVVVTPAVWGAYAQILQLIEAEQTNGILRAIGRDVERIAHVQVALARRKLWLTRLALWVRGVFRKPKTQPEAHA